MANWLYDKKGIEWWHILIIIAILLFLFKGCDNLSYQKDLEEGKKMIQPRFYDSDGNEIFMEQSILGNTFATIDGVGSEISFIDFVITVTNTGEAELENVGIDFIASPPTPGPFETALSGQTSKYTLQGLVDSQPGTGESGQWTSDLIDLEANPSLLNAPSPTVFCVTAKGQFFSNDQYNDLSKTGCLELTIGADECVGGYPFYTCINDFGLYCDAGAEVQEETCCVDPGFEWNAGAGECQEIACIDGTLHDQCSASSYGMYCTSTGTLIDDCNTCDDCGFILDGNGNPYECDTGTGICEPQSFGADFILDVGSGTGSGTSGCVDDTDCTSPQVCDVPSGTCVDPAPAGTVIFRTNEPNGGDYRGSSGVWVAIDIDGDSAMEGFGYLYWASTTSSTCSTDPLLGYTMEGHPVHKLSDTKVLVCVQDVSVLYRIQYDLNAAAASQAVLTPTPTEPYTSNNQEVYE
jgi:hypothetical protein